MSSTLGDQIRAARRRRGWGQAELARELDLRQQTVSRWERGESRPQRHVVAKLASLLDLDQRELVALAGYGALADRPVDAPPPVRPRVTVLPVAELSPDRFEELVADLARLLHPEAHVSRFGAQGHAQHGFDVVAASGGRFPAAYQCKRRERFGPADVWKAVEDVTLDVDEAYLVLTRVASPACRTEIVKHGQWTLWDVEDLSREIRDLPVDEAVRIVDTYFPGWREPLLGVSEPGPWVRTDEFFRPLMSSAVYTHQWLLVGRDEQLSGALGMLNGLERVGCLVGRGGIGKSRLLSEIASRAETAGNQVRFVSAGTDVEPRHLELLPASGQLLVIVDDAHERSDLAPLLVGVMNRNSHAKVILGLRPYGLGLLSSDLRRIGLHPSELPRWELDDLSVEDAESLAEQALGDASSPAVVRRLAQLSSDCPLITVVAGALIERGQLDAACLDHEETVRAEVLRAFRDVLVADPLGGDADARRAVLEGVSALQPFRSDDPGFQGTLADVVGQPYDRLLPHLRGLEDAGVLLRRGSSLRVVPDLLGDVVFTDACFDDRGAVPTGYLERVVEQAAGAPLQHLFLNASRIDWRIRHDNSSATSLTDKLWRQVESDFDEAGVLGRQQLLDLLRRVAHFAPERTLHLVVRAIETPTEVVEEVGDLEGAFLRLHTPTHDDVLRQLPPLLRGIGYHLSHLPEVLGLLWDLGRGDNRPTNQYPEHALRVLHDLADLELGKPLAFNHAVIDAVERWLAEDLDGVHSPFEVLDPMLTTEGSEDRAIGHQLVFKPFVLTPESVASLRQRVLGVAFGGLRSADLRVAVRAVGTIGSALRYPHGLFGREVEASERDAWTPEFVDTLDRLAHVLVTTDLDPAVVIAIRQAIRWHVEHSGTETREAAKRVRAVLPDREDDQIAEALFDGWARLAEGPRSDFAKAQADRDERSRVVASEVVSTRSNEEILDLLEERLNAQGLLSDTGGNTGPFIWALIEESPSMGIAIARRVANDPGSPLLGVAATAVAAVGVHAATEFMGVIRQLLDSDDLRVRQQVGQALGWNRGGRSTLVEGEVDLLHELAGDEDEYIRSCVVRAGQRLAPNLPHEAVQLIGAVRFADSAAVADEIFQMLGPHGELDWRQLPPETLEKLLAELELCPSIEDYWTNAFLSDVSGERPDKIADLLKRRVCRWEDADATSKYRALPFSWDHQLLVRECDSFKAILSGIRDWIAEAPESWQRQNGGADLFVAVACGFDETVMSVLEEGASLAASDQMDAVAAILREAPRTFVFDEVEFVRRVLGLAERLGEEHAQRVGGALSAAAMSGTRTGTPGKPFAEDVNQRDRAREVASTLPNGSIEQRLYGSLQESAEHSIQWQVDRDGELMDRREW
ncbi:MAG: helix-turn-helix domain-containing protein [Hyphomicrobiales bacterium]|nr:helix-turn-helix domain-containing protein [Hyphomicrobiales bacterium]